MKSMAQQLAVLQQMSPAQLREKYLEVFGEPSRTGNKDFLVKRVAWRIQSLAEGGLSERARQRAAEIARDADIRMTIPKAPAAPVPKTKPCGLPPAGTVLTRPYKGRLIEVTVLADGFDHEGTHYRSLSAIARKITGTQWNGHLFFGLRDKA